MQEVIYTHGMSVRLQVLLSEEEIRLYRRIAREAGMTLSAWVRQCLRSEARERPGGDVARKLQAIRASTRHAFPAPDIEQMLEETTRGYVEEGS